MKILFISSYFPKHLRTSKHGVYKRMSMFIDAIKQIAEIDMLFYVTKEDYKRREIEDTQKALSEHWGADINLYLCQRSEFDEGTEIRKWLSFGAGIVSFNKQKDRIEYSGKEQVKALEECLDNNPDAVFAHRLSAMCPLLLTKRSLPPVFFDMDDIEHIVLSRYLENRKNIKSKLLKLLLPELKKGENDALKLARRTFVCSEKDRMYLSRGSSSEGITVVPNSVAVPTLEPMTENQTLLFLGADYGPNIEAGEFLVNDIWPLIKQSLPEARLIIAGIDAERFKFRESNIDGLETPGFVEDLGNLYKNTMVTAVPMLVGGGTRFKIIEAAMYGKPCVSTSIGAEGIELEHGEEIIIQDKAEAFANACIKLLSDRELSMHIGILARSKAMALYDRNNVVNSIKEYILQDIS